MKRIVATLVLFLALPVAVGSGSSPRIAFAAVPPVMEATSANPSVDPEASATVTYCAEASDACEHEVKGVREGDVRFRVELKSDQIKTPAVETESTHIYQEPWQTAEVP